jgi:hypothetical protein
LRYLGAHAKLQNPTTTPFWEKSKGLGEKERKIMPFVVATYVYASSQGQRMHSAQTNLTDKIVEKGSDDYEPGRSS